ncbi:MAG: 30S ribosomal protein S27ae [Candidatus Woesearchaeota archaeon]|nr:MAG: 30S ribosomal protein S27ae [Candidatus Woesearchaeota archaeon]
MAKKKVKNKKPSKKYSKYKIEGSKVIRSKTCPKCPPGTFLGDHKDRLYCGQCHYTEYKRKSL